MNTIEESCTKENRQILKNLLADLWLLDKDKTLYNFQQYDYEYKRLLDYTIQRLYNNFTKKNKELIEKQNTMNKLDKNNTREALEELIKEVINMAEQWYNHDINNEQYLGRKETLIRETIEKIHADDNPLSL